MRATCLPARVTRFMITPQAVYFPSGERCFARMLEELEQAEHYIFLEFFIIDNGKMWDAILDVLRRKAMQGVDVRVMYDDFGCITRLPMRYLQKAARDGHSGARVQSLYPRALRPTQQPRPPQAHDHRRKGRLYGRGQSRGRIHQRNRALRALEGLRHSGPR